MSARSSIWVQGIGAWAPGLADWSAWRAMLRGAGEPDTNAPARPKPGRLAAGERRRVSTHVLAAIEVADQAVVMSGHDAADLPCIFSSAHGDASTMDYMCTVLADTPQHLSPTRFHNSVHNAAVGYWTIASHCHAASNAVAAGASSFGAGLLEAAVQALTEKQPVLLVAHDQPGSGPLGAVLGTSHTFACALVLSPHATDTAMARLEFTLTGDTVITDPARHPHAATLAQDNPSARGLPLLEALATDTPRPVHLHAAPALGLTIQVTPLPAR